MQFSVFGPVVVERDGLRVSVPRSQRRGLLALLLLNEGRLLSVDAICEALWGGAAPATARQQIQTGIHAIRMALRDLDGEDAVMAGPAGYGIAAGYGTLDLARFEEMIERARTLPPAEAAGMLRQALAQWRGPALADASGAFVEPARSRLEDQRLAAIEDLARIELARGNTEAALQEIRPLIETHPLRERLRESHMLALYRAGRPTEALESFRDLRARLAEEHGLAPGPALVALQQRIIEADPALLPGPVVRTRGNLPADTTTFVGRRAEVAEVARLLAGSRLVTLTGVGGVGKTRLAVHVGRDLAPQTPDGVWLVDLSGLGDPGLVAETVGEALGVAGQTARPPADELRDHLADRRTLLILDTCEHLVEACAHLTESLLRGAPGLRVLATSREALALPGERVYAVRPMAGSGDGAALFAERARDVDREFALARHHDQVARLCDRLDGIPLAIELAAVRLRVMTVAEMLERVDARFALLGGTRTAQARHQTLRTAIEWSHQLCSAGERALWARLSIFPGTFDLRAAEDVGASEDTADVWRVLAGLVDKSIVMREHDGRYRLLDAIREFGRERLREIGEEERSARLHRDHYHALSLRFEAEWFGPGQVEWCDRLLREDANLRAALDFGVSRPGERLRALELAAALWPLWAACGRLREGRHHLDRALAAAAEPSPQRTKALWACGHLTVGQGDLTATRRLAADCMAAATSVIAEGAGTVEAEDALIYAFHLEAVAATLAGEHAVAEVATRRALARHREGDGPPARLLTLLISRAFALLHAGDPHDAQATLAEHRAVAEGLGEIWTRSWGDYIGSQVALVMGRLNEAAALAAGSLRARYLLRDSLGMANCADTLAQVAVAAGDGERAARLLGLGHQLWRDYGHPQMGSPELRDARARCEAAARALAGDSRYEAGFAEGAALGLAEAVEDCEDPTGCLTPG
ncbi:ATP-binding protein [Streptosporangium sp. OZ121]|uniref:ATP-binding protein n=1 Tax=Streptosporangium sp. OZ121 TaxID=3444183 RepID=UPI003F79126D